MFRSLFRALLRNLLVVLIFVPVATFLPLAAFWLCSSPTGTVVWFFVGPWSAAFWTLIYSQWSSAHRWRRSGRELGFMGSSWRSAHGGIQRTVPRAIGWTFGGLFFSYVAELFALWLRQKFVYSSMWLPAFTYSPLAFCWLWRRRHA